MKINNISTDLKKIFSLIFKINIKKINNKIDFKKIKNWDSLNHVKLIMVLESKFDISIKPNEANKLLSYDKIYRFIKKKKKL